MIVRKKIASFTSLVLFGAVLCYGQEDEASAAEMAKKLQDPLAHISAIMSDNDLLFKTGNDDFSFSSSIQPVQAWSLDDKGFNFIFRAVVPVVALAPEASKPPYIDEPVSSSGTTFGLSDIITQYFFSPKTDGAWKWGLGPMISLRTRTSDKLAGPGWGAGPVGVLVGGAGDFSFAFIGGHLWGDQDGFSTTIFQPMVYYNFPSSPGLALSYNNQWSYSWSASSGNEWSLPLGLSISKTFAMKGNHGMDLGIGPYWMAAKPKGAAESMIRITFAWLFP